VEHVEDAGGVLDVGAIAHGLEEADLAALVGGVGEDRDLLDRIDAVVAAEDLMQVGEGRLGLADVVPAERVLVAGVALKHLELHLAGGHEGLGRGLRVVERVDRIGEHVEKVL
jgi:hypothetical protein